MSKKSQSRKKSLFISIFVEVDVLFQPSSLRTSHGQIQKVREGRRNENTRLFHSVFSHVKPPMPLKGVKNHTHTHTTWDVSSDLHLHGIISQASYEFRDDTFDGSSPEASAHNHMEIVRTEKLTKTGTSIADIKENQWKDIKSLKKLHTSTSTWSPALHLFRKDLVKVYKTELKHVHPKVNGFTPLTPNSIGSQMRNESLSIREIFRE